MMVGHSLGGYVTLAFVELFPDLLSGYVLFHSHPHADSPEAIASRNREIAVVSAGRKNIMYPGIRQHDVCEGEPEGPCMHSLNGPRRSHRGIRAKGIIAMLNGMIVRPSRQYILENGRFRCCGYWEVHDLYFSPEKAMSGYRPASQCRGGHTRTLRSPRLHRGNRKVSLPAEGFCSRINLVI
jgi:pimeloyl-ACP methyl ester carboxylesterase